MRPECELSIITINYNGLKDTCALIETIPFNDKLEVIVVDNASDNQEADQISSRFPHVKVIKSDKNLGFAGGNNLGIKASTGKFIFLIKGNNLGIKASTGKFIFLINNDTYFEDFNVWALIDRLNSSSDIGIVCPKIRFAWSPRPIQFAGYTPLSNITIRNQAIGFGEEDHGQYETAHPTPYAHGAAMLIKREAIDIVGLMPECYFLYYEELDWSMMFTRAGYQIWYEPKCTIYHKESQATGQQSPLRTYYISRNRLLLIKRNYHGITKWLSYIYIIGIVGVRDILRYLFIGRFSHIKATSQGILNFVKI